VSSKDAPAEKVVRDWSNCLLSLRQKTFYFTVAADGERAKDQELDQLLTGNAFEICS
jgi:hypothetical protein